MTKDLLLLKDGRFESVSSRAYVLKIEGGYK